MTQQQDEVILTAQQVSEWMNRKNDLEERLHVLQVEIDDLSRKLDAVKVIRSDLFQRADSTGSNRADASEDGESMMDAVARITAQSPSPMTKLQIKRRLVDEGFERSRLGNYFYTVIARLKDKERIQVLPDGRVRAGRSISPNGNAGIAIHD